MEFVKTILFAIIFILKIDMISHRFYETYQTVFMTIEDEDRSFYDGDPKEFRYPMFGRSDSPVELWQEFYNFFEVYSTTRSYSWLEKYDVRGENRRIQRLAEKENKKIRDAGNILSPHFRCFFKIQILKFHMNFLIS